MTGRKTLVRVLLLVAYLGANAGVFLLLLYRPESLLGPAVPILGVGALNVCLGALFSVAGAAHCLLGRRRRPPG